MLDRGIAQAPGRRALRRIRAGMRQRLAEYAIKAAREAKLSTSWLDPDGDYEELLRRYVQLLAPGSVDKGFARYFGPVIEQVGYFGALNSSAAVAIKFTVPSLPDIYQGNEANRLVLVDPDNRGAIDFRRYDQYLSAMEARVAASSLAGVAGELLATCEDGGLKTFITWRLLWLRRAEPGIFSEGRYMAIPASGQHADHLIAYQRSHENRSIIVAVARWAATLMEGRRAPPLGAAWKDTALVLPEQVAAGKYLDVLTGQEMTIAESAQTRQLPLAELFETLPVTVLLHQAGPPGR